MVDAPTSYVVMREGRYYSGNGEFAARSPQEGAILFYSRELAEAVRSQFSDSPTVLAGHECEPNERGRVRSGYVVYRPPVYWRRTVGILPPWVDSPAKATIFQTYGGAKFVCDSVPGSIVISAIYASGEQSLFSFAGLSASPAA